MTSCLVPFMNIKPFDFALFSIYCDRLKASLTSHNSYSRTGRVFMKRAFHSSHNNPSRACQYLFLHSNTYILGAATDPTQYSTIHSDRAVLINTQNENNRALRNKILILYSCTCTSQSHHKGYDWDMVKVADKGQAV
jgi:hypothetical protein